MRRGGGGRPPRGVFLLSVRHEVHLDHVELRSEHLEAFEQVDVVLVCPRPVLALTLVLGHLLEPVVEATTTHTINQSINQSIQSINPINIMCKLL